MKTLIMSPAPGERLLRFTGDCLQFQLQRKEGFPEGWQARLRTNLGRGEALRHEIINEHSARLRLPGASWQDLPMKRGPGGWILSLPLTDVGFFRAKAYAIDPSGGQHWPEGLDFGVSVHPDSCRTANTLYCAFPRMFGPTKPLMTTVRGQYDSLLGALDKAGYSSIPPSGTLRDLKRELPHIVNRLGCRILHLLPIGPTPTTYARFGRFGSPYAIQDLLAIDPALVEFDRRTTGIEQFCELTHAAHVEGARVFLDVVINHTGWGSSLQETHPEWFVRREDGSFVSPGAWGVTWEDLIELNHSNPALWEHLADVFLEWCRRGVDGFRCDAGYMIPVVAWRYITARVLDEFPETIFLLEGLGGSWKITEQLLTEGMMQWAYSELFQNYSGTEVAQYLDYALQQSERIGVYTHYSETHDNDRLARRGRAWSLLRNQLCALTSVNGAFGFTCGVEWLAAEQIKVHESRGLSWGNPENLLAELRTLNELLIEHPCFFDGAILRRLSKPDSPVLMLSRVSAEGKDTVLVLVNTDVEQPHTVRLDETIYGELGRPKLDLLGQPPMLFHSDETGQIQIDLSPGQCSCLAATPKPMGLSGDFYREARGRAAWAIGLICKRYGLGHISSYNWRWLADLVQTDPERFLGTLPHLDRDLMEQDLVEALEKALAEAVFPRVVVWRPAQQTRVTMVPRDHYLLIEDTAPFRAILKRAEGTPQHLGSLRVGDRHVACYPDGQVLGPAELILERFDGELHQLKAALSFIELPSAGPISVGAQSAATTTLLTNGRGGMARLQVDFGSVKSKYDCLLGANLHPAVPVDRHVFVKRARAWIVADGFITPLNANNLASFQPGPPATWRFVASAGNDRAVEIHLTADMLEEQNATLLRFERPTTPLPFGQELDPACRVSITVRFDIEDRSFHQETVRNDGADHHFSTHIQETPTGFEFSPTEDRSLSVTADAGQFHAQPEWCQGVFHELEASRGQTAQGDAYSPGWFDVPLNKGQAAMFTVTAEGAQPAQGTRAGFEQARKEANQRALNQANLPPEDQFGRQLALAVQAFAVRRDSGKTVIAGYPWFLDWGRDSLIAARGFLAAGASSSVEELLVTFGRFVDRGTLPNIIHGEDASNRDTSDAPLWYGVVCEDIAQAGGHRLYSHAVDPSGLTVVQVLQQIASGYRDGTPNGIRMDPASALIWSPPHFTWMDTNYPACTPREGYPIEIQALWIRLLRQLARLQIASDSEPWANLAERAERSFWELFWSDERGYFADLLVAPAGQSPNEATPDTALRPNQLVAVSLGLVDGTPARRSVQAAARHLLVPGAMRSLAPLPVSPPLAVHSPDGHLLNDPIHPYRGRYEGDEDTSRKVAYHNGTSWTWQLPVFCEALARAWNFDPAAVHTARVYLGSLDTLLRQGCLGQLPEILDGDAPHTQRGCDAQAWSVTEALRVWKLLS